MMMTTVTLMSPHHQKSVVTAERKAAFTALFSALEPFCKEAPLMTVTNLMAFLRVGMDEGRGVGEYAKEAAVFKNVMTRHLQDLGPRDRDGEEGLNWIYQARRNDDLRVNRAWVTQKGAAMIDTARRALDLLLRR
jgi:hypothetical protein